MMQSGRSGLGQFGPDLGFRVGQRQDDRRARHGLDHVLRQHTGGRAAQEHVGAIDHVGQRACIGVLRDTLLWTRRTRPGGRCR
jgi:hypothetical protein